MRSAAASPWQDDQGVTLVELLVALTMASVLAASVMGVVVTVFRTQNTIVETRVAMDEARLAVERMRREIREARTAIVSPDGTEIAMWIDSNGDDAIGAGEAIAYRLVADSAGSSVCSGETTAGGARLVRQVDATPAHVLGCQFLPGPLFTPSGTPTDQVAITLTAETRSDANGLSTVTVDDVVRLRNVS